MYILFSPVRAEEEMSMIIITQGFNPGLIWGQAYSLQDNDTDNFKTTALIGSIQMKGWLISDNIWNKQ